MERSRNNAFYTSPEVVKGMWEGLRQAGADKLDNPTVLEPSAGSGRFLEMQPRDRAARSNRVEVEPNPLTNYSGSIGTLGWFARGICHGLTAALHSPPLDVFTFCPSSLLACRLLHRGEKRWSFMSYAFVSSPTRGVDAHVNRIIRNWFTKRSHSKYSLTQGTDTLESY